MTFQQPLLLLCLLLVALTAVAEPARIRKARQGAISVEALSFGPGPVSLQSSSSTSTKPGATTTMSQTSSSEQHLSSSSSSSHLSTSASPSSVLPSFSPSGSSASPSSSKTSSATPQPSSSSGSINIAVQNMTTCTSGLISWNYSGKEAELFLSITNIGVDSTSSRIKARQSTINNTMQQQLVVTNTSVSNWTWSSVNVTQGWYEIQGLVLTSPNVSNDSTPFFVTNGTNVACLIDTSPQASSTASPGSTSLSVTSNKNVAGIVGGVVGAVVGVILAIIAGVYVWKRKRKFAGGGGSKNRKWGSLESTSSSIQPEGSGAPAAGVPFHTHSDSTGAILQDVAGGKASATTTPGGSDEDVATTGEEKLVSPASSSSMTPFDALNTPVHYDRRASVYTQQTQQTPTSITNEAPWSRSPPRRISNQSLEQQAQRIRSSMETSMRRRGERLSMPTLPSPSISRLPQSPMLSQPNEEYPLSPVPPAAVTPVNRSISAGAVSMTTRRASRKPVPQYDPSLLLEDPNIDSVSTFTGGAESSHSHGTGTGTGTYGTPPDSVHKGSFGDGRPVHYLIPDMPLPQRD